MGVRKQLKNGRFPLVSYMANYEREMLEELAEFLGATLSGAVRYCIRFTHEKHRRGIERWKDSLEKPERVTQEDAR